MATLAPSLSAQAQALGVDDGYTTVANTEVLSDNIDATGAFVTHVIVEAQFVGGPTDDLLIALYGSHDGADFDDVGLSAVTMDNTKTQLSLFVGHPAHYRVGVTSTGATDAVSVRVYERHGTVTSS